MYWMAGVSCSTPFGITGSFTDPVRTVAAHRVGAQRLSASLVLSLAILLDDVLDGRRQLLNAFRHHWFFHRPGEDGCRSPGRCSTPFGITGSFTRDTFGRCIGWQASVAQRLSASLVLSQTR